MTLLSSVKKNKGIYFDIESQKNRFKADRKVLQ